MHAAVVIALLILPIGSLAADRASKWPGKWKLNPAKSKVNSSYSDVVSDVVTVRRIDNNTYLINQERTLSSGEKRSISTTRICDGKEHRNSNQVIPTMYVCDPETLRLTIRRDGRLFSDRTGQFSADGKTHTTFRKEYGPDGKLVFEDVIVFERQ